MMPWRWKRWLQSPLVVLLITVAVTPSICVSSVFAFEQYDHLRPGVFAQSTVLPHEFIDEAWLGTWLGAGGIDAAGSRRVLNRAQIFTEVAFSKEEITLIDLRFLSNVEGPPVLFLLKELLRQEAARLGRPVERGDVPTVVAEKLAWAAQHLPRKFAFYDPEAKTLVEAAQTLAALKQQIERFNTAQAQLGKQGMPVPFDAAWFQAPLVFGDKTQALQQLHTAGFNTLPAQLPDQHEERLATTPSAVLQPFKPTLPLSADTARPSATPSTTQPVATPLGGVVPAAVSPVLSAPLAGLSVNTFAYRVAALFTTNRCVRAWIGLAGLLIEIPALVWLGTSVLDPSGMAAVLMGFTGLHLLLQRFDRSVAARPRGALGHLSGFGRQLLVFTPYLLLTIPGLSTMALMCAALAAVLVHVAYDLVQLWGELRPAAPPAPGVTAPAVIPASPDVQALVNNFLSTQLASQAPAALAQLRANAGRLHSVPGLSWVVPVELLTDPATTTEQLFNWLVANSGRASMMLESALEQQGSALNQALAAQQVAVFQAFGAWLGAQSVPAARVNEAMDWLAQIWPQTVTNLRMSGDTLEIVCTTNDNPQTIYRLSRGAAGSLVVAVTPPTALPAPPAGVVPSAPQQPGWSPMVHVLFGIVGTLAAIFLYMVFRDHDVSARTAVLASSPAALASLSSGWLPFVAVVWSRTGDWWLRWAITRRAGDMARRSGYPSGTAFLRAIFDDAELPLEAVAHRLSLERLLEAGWWERASIGERLQFARVLDDLLARTAIIDHVAAEPQLAGVYQAVTLPNGKTKVVVPYIPGATAHNQRLLTDIKLRYAGRVVHLVGDERARTLLGVPDASVEELPDYTRLDRDGQHALRYFIGTELVRYDLERWAGYRWVRAVFRQLFRFRFWRMTLRPIYLAYLAQEELAHGRDPSRLLLRQAALEAEQATLSGRTLAQIDLRRNAVHEELATQRTLEEGADVTIDLVPVDRYGDALMMARQRGEAMRRASSEASAGRVPTPYMLAYDGAQPVVARTTSMAGRMALVASGVADRWASTTIFGVPVGRGLREVAGYFTCRELANGIRLGLAYHGRPVNETITRVWNRGVTTPVNMLITLSILAPGFLSRHDLQYLIEHPHQAKRVAALLLSSLPRETPTSVTINGRGVLFHDVYPWQQSPDERAQLEAQIEAWKAEGYVVLRSDLMVTRSDAGAPAVDDERQLAGCPRLDDLNNLRSHLPEGTVSDAEFAAYRDQYRQTERVVVRSVQELLADLERRGVLQRLFRQAGLDYTHALAFLNDAFAMIERAAPGFLASQPADQLYAMAQLYLGERVAEETMLGSAFVKMADDKARLGHLSTETFHGAHVMERLASDEFAHLPPGTRIIVIGDGRVNFVARGLAQQPQEADEILRAGNGYEPKVAAMQRRTEQPSVLDQARDRLRTVPGVYQTLRVLLRLGLFTLGAASVLAAVTLTVSAFLLPIPVLLPVAMVMVSIAVGSLVLIGSVLAIPKIIIGLWVGGTIILEWGGRWAWSFLKWAGRPFKQPVILVGVTLQLGARGLYALMVRVPWEIKDWWFYRGLHQAIDRAIAQRAGGRTRGEVLAEVLFEDWSHVTADALVSRLRDQFHVDPGALSAPRRQKLDELLEQYWQEALASGHVKLPPGGDYYRLPDGRIAGIKVPVSAASGPGLEETAYVVVHHLELGLSMRRAQVRPDNWYTRQLGDETAAIKARGERIFAWELWGREAGLPYDHEIWNIGYVNAMNRQWRHLPNIQGLVPWYVRMVQQNPRLVRLLEFAPCHAIVGTLLKVPVLRNVCQHDPTLRHLYELYLVTDAMRAGDWNALAAGPISPPWVDGRDSNLVYLSDAAVDNLVRFQTLRPGEVVHLYVPAQATGLTVSRLLHKYAAHQQLALKPEDYHPTANELRKETHPEAVASAETVGRKREIAGELLEDQIARVTRRIELRLGRPLPAMLQVATLKRQGQSLSALLEQLLIIDEVTTQARYRFGERADREIVDLMYTDAGQPEEVIDRLRTYGLIRPEQYAELVVDHARQLLLAIKNISEEELQRASPADQARCRTLRQAWSPFNALLDRPAGHWTREAAFLNRQQQEETWALLARLGRDVPSDMLTRLVATLWATLDEQVIDQPRPVEVPGFEARAVAVTPQTSVGNEHDYLFTFSRWPKHDPEAERTELAQLRQTIEHVLETVPDERRVLQVQNGFLENLELRVRAMHARLVGVEEATTPLTLQQFEAQVEVLRSQLLPDEQAVLEQSLHHFTYQGQEYDLLAESGSVDDALTLLYPAHPTVQAARQAYINTLHRKRLVLTAEGEEYLRLLGRVKEYSDIVYLPYDTSDVDESQMEAYGLRQFVWEPTLAEAVGGLLGWWSGASRVVRDPLQLTAGATGLAAFVEEISGDRIAQPVSREQLDAVLLHVRLHTLPEQRPAFEQRLARCTYRGATYDLQNDVRGTSASEGEIRRAFLDQELRTAGLEAVMRQAIEAAGLPLVTSAPRLATACTWLIANVGKVPNVVEHGHEFLRFRAEELFASEIDPALQARLIAAEAAIVQQQAEITRLQQQIGDAERASANATVSVASLNQRMTALQQELTGLDPEAKHRRWEINNRELPALKVQLAAAVATLTQAEVALKSAAQGQAHADLDRARRALASAATERETVRGTINQSRAKIPPALEPIIEELAEISGGVLRKEVVTDPATGHRVNEFVLNLVPEMVPAVLEQLRGTLLYDRLNAAYEEYVDEHVRPQSLLPEPLRRESARRRNGGELTIDDRADNNLAKYITKARVNKIYPIAPDARTGKPNHAAPDTFTFIVDDGVTVRRVAYGLTHVAEARDIVKNRRSSPTASEMLDNQAPRNAGFLWWFSLGHSRLETWLLSPWFGKTVQPWIRHRLLTLPIVRQVHLRFVEETAEGDIPRRANREFSGRARTGVDEQARRAAAREAKREIGKIHQASPNLDWRVSHLGWLRLFNARTFKDFGRFQGWYRSMFIRMVQANWREVRDETPLAKGMTAQDGKDAQCRTRRAVVEYENSVGD